MFLIIRIIVSSGIYLIMGSIFYLLTDRYIEELVEKVREVDYRFEKRMYFKIPIKNDNQKFIYSVILLILWPVVCIASILKAEKQYDIIVRHAVNRKAP